MIENSKILQGTAAWFEMVVVIMRDAALQAKLSPSMNISLVERYTDGVEFINGRYQGIRIEVQNGKPSFQVGVRTDEQADITVELTSAAARQLNMEYISESQAIRKALLKSGEMRVKGDPSMMGSWMDATHDQIVDRTI